MSTSIAEAQPVSAQDDLIRVLENSLYPGAKRQSIELVLAYCRVNHLDPMLKPVHIVPTRVKNTAGQWETRDALMPGIADYRIKAARSGEYGGKSEPEFGPVKELAGGEAGTVKYPEWCRVTVSRIVQGQARTFTATERWLENYATANRDTDLPNSMWRKRAFGQLAKCTEAQALRMAFPEFSGGQPTAEEMEGKDTFAGQTIEHDPRLETERERGKRVTAEWRAEQAAAASMQRAARITEKAGDYEAEPPPPQRVTLRQWLDEFEARCAAAQTQEEGDRILREEAVLRLDDPALQINENVRSRALAVRKAMVKRLWPEPPEDEAEPEPLEIIGEAKIAAG